MKRSVRAKEFARGVGVLALFLATASVCLAAGLGRWASWDDRESESFDVAPGTMGNWDLAFEEEVGGERTRPIWLVRTGADTAPAEPGVELRLRVEPLAALDEITRARTGEDGWLTWRVDVDRHPVIEEPTRVRCITWSVERVEALLGVPHRLVVPGSSDGQPARLWPYAGATSVVLLAVAVLDFLRTRRT